MKVLRICFVALDAYPVLNPQLRAAIGGMEVRAVLFARHLAQRPGFEISLLANDFGQAPDEKIEGVRVLVYPRGGTRRIASLYWRHQRHVANLRQCQSSAGAASWLRRIALLTRVPYDSAARLALAAMLRFTNLRNARSAIHGKPNPLFESIGADVYVAVGVNNLSAQVVASARHYGAKSLLALASDWNLQEIYRPGSWRRDHETNRAGACYYAIHNADAILVQTESQRRLLRERFGREGTLIRNPIPLDPSTTEYVPPSQRAGNYFLWIGRADRVKRPNLLVDLAERCPEVPFICVMNPCIQAVREEVTGRLPENVKLIDQVPYTEIDEFVRNARALVNTSATEGMPNTFLQAGKYGKPVLSLLVDPDEMLCRSGGGLVAGGSIEQMADQVRQMMADLAGARQRGAALQEYVRQHHGLDDRVAELERLLRDVYSRPEKESHCRESR